MLDDDRRDSPRKPIQVEVEVTDGKEVIEADTLNISRSGVFVCTTRTIDIGSTVEVSLSLPGHAFPITIVGDVVRKEAFDKEFDSFVAPGIAVQFTALDEEADSALEKLTADDQQIGARVRKLPIHLKVSYTSLDSFAEYYKNEIKKGGTFLESERVLPVGTMFEFQMAVPGVPAPVKLLGEVVYVHEQSGPNDKPTGMGIKFQYRNEMHRKMLEDLVRPHLDDSDEIDVGIETAGDT